MHCWEDVEIDNVTNYTLLHFLHTLRDALTVEELPGSLLPLQVCSLQCACTVSAMPAGVVLLAHLKHC